MAAPVPGLEPLTSPAMCVHAAPGVYALLLGAGVSRAAGLPTGWDTVTDLVRREPVPATHTTVRSKGPQRAFDLVLDTGEEIT
jgi:hypothetical protein